MSDVAEPQRRSRQTTRRLWAERLARFPDSGLSVTAFCAAEGVLPNSFYYWKRQLADAAAVGPGAPPLFLPVRVTPAAPVELALPSGAVLRLAPGCDLAFVRSLLDALAGAPC
jgi:transposase